MRVTFVLPGASHRPVGGARMVFLYANALAAAGWEPLVLMAANPGDVPWRRRLTRRLRYHVFKYTGGFSPSRWQRLHPGVRLGWVPDLAPERAPVGEAVVATAVRTAEMVAGWPESAGRKFYFVQALENWDFPEARIEASWRLPSRKIAISRWLCGLIAEAGGGEAAHLPNGLDQETFGLDLAPEARRPIVLLSQHPRRQKCPPEVRKALAEVKRRRPEVELRSFGPGRGLDAPGLGICHTRNPAQAELRRLYNEAMVVVAPSTNEGWGLPASEALQCGCGLAASDIGGHREFLRHGENALLHRPDDMAELAANVDRLLTDDVLRLRLARQGRSDMSERTVEGAAARLREILRGGEDA